VSCIVHQYVDSANFGSRRRSICAQSASRDKSAVAKPARPPLLEISAHVEASSFSVRAVRKHGRAFIREKMGDSPSNATP